MHILCIRYKNNSFLCFFFTLKFAQARRSQKENNDGLKIEFNVNNTFKHLEYEKHDDEKVAKKKPNCLMHKRIISIHTRNV